MMKYIISLSLSWLFALSLSGQPDRRTVRLPDPAYDSAVSLEWALRHRRSRRDYTGDSLTLAELGQLLWAAQGITAGGGYRTAPSAGALYPLEIYVVAGRVEDLPAGVYQYQPQGHRLRWRQGGDLRRALRGLALGQAWVQRGAADLVIAGVYERTTTKYGERGERYVHMEAGHACQNIYLQATALGLGTVSVGAFQDQGVQALLGLRREERPLCIMPVGRVR